MSLYVQFYARIFLPNWSTQTQNTPSGHDQHGLFVGTVRLPFSVREAPKTGRCVAGWRLLAADA